MEKFNFFTLSLKNLKRKAFRTGILISSIGLLVSLLIFAISFTISVSSTIEKSANRLGADLIIIPSGASRSVQEFLLESENRTFYMPKDVINKLKKIAGINPESITYQVYLSTIAAMCCDVPQTQVIAFNPETDFIVKPWLYKSLSQPLKKGEAIAGFGTYDNLSQGMLSVEQVTGKLSNETSIVIKLFNHYFKITRVMDKTGTGLDTALFITEKNLNKMIASEKPPVKPDNTPLKKGEISVIFANIKPGYDPYEVAKSIDGNIIEVDVVDRRNMGQKILATLKDINKIFLISIILTSILTIFLVWGIFSAIANERSKEIGIMRAIGARENHIAKLFIFEVLAVGLIGSIIGTFVGTALSYFLNQTFTLLSTISAYLSILDQVLVSIVGIVIGTGICIIGAIVPINRIKKIEPLLIMKGE